jgi:glycerol-3-phosphate dehydrogenase
MRISVLGAGAWGTALAIAAARQHRVLLWARDAGHPTVVTDWRETNLLASRAWPSLGFRPTFRRLFRAIA